MKTPSGVLSDLSIPALPSSLGDRDWHRVFGEFKKKLQLICAHPLIAHDSRCSELLLAMAAVQTTPELAPLVDEFAHRVLVLLEERGAETAPELRASLGRRSPKGVKNFTAGAAGSDTVPSAGAGRTRLRL